MAAKKSVLTTVAASSIGAAAVLGAANEAEALYYLRWSSTDFLSNFATKSTSTSAGFSIAGANSLGLTTAYGYRSGSTVYANIYSQGGSMYARAYARCYSSQVGGVYSAVYSDYSNNSTYKSISCSSLPAGLGPWSMVGWGVAVMSLEDSSVPGTTRKLCDGQGCGAPDSMKVSNVFLGCYPALTSTKTGIGGYPTTASVPGPSTVCACW